MSAVQMHQLPPQGPLEANHDARVGAAVSAGGVEATAEEVLGSHAPLLQHLQDGCRPHLGCARRHLNNIDETLLA